jgi:hypothetical protein
MIIPEADGQRTPETIEESCAANISTAERRNRLVAGAVQFLFSLAVLAALIVFGVDRWWRLALFPIFWGTAVGFFQWRDKT